MVDIPFYVIDGLILFALGIGIGAAGAIIPRYIRWNVGSFRIAEIYDERPGGFFMVLRKRISLGTTQFTIGKEFTFIVPNPPPVVMYNGSHGVLHYVLNRERPRHIKVGDKTVKSFTIKPQTVAVVAPPNVPGAKKSVQMTGPKGTTVTKEIDTNPDTESRSTHLIHKRSLVEQLAKATGSQSLAAALPIIILVAVAAFFIAYVIFVQVHPGFIQGPPPGYYYKTCPIPINGTYVQGQGVAC